MLKKVGKMFRGAVHKFDEWTNFLSGAIDVIVCEQPDGSYRSTPFQLKFGNSDASFHRKNQVVRIILNGKLLKTLCMVLDEDGVGFFQSFPVHRSEKSNKRRKKRSRKKNMERRVKSFSSIDQDYDAKNPIQEVLFEEMLEDHHPLPESIDEVIEDDNIFHFPPLSSERRTNELSSKQLRALDLKEGRNDVEFAVFSRVLGWKKTYMNIFLWNHKDRIAIVDIDGTITRTDVMGHVLFFLGTDWAMHRAMKKLLFKLHASKYKILYLTTRALIMSPQTRNQIRHICGLPDGPSVMTTDTVTYALYRELSKQSFFWKKEKLNSLKEDVKLNFVAAFGNRKWDYLSYKYIKIPEESIFTQSDFWGYFVKGSNEKAIGKHISFLVDHFDDFF